MRDYGKVQCTFWTDPDVKELTDDCKLLFLYLLTTEHATCLGCYRLPDGYVSEDLNWDVETVGELFRALSRKGFVTVDERSKWVLVHGFLRFNKVENPNQGKAAAKLFEQIPDAVTLKRCLADEIRRYAPAFPSSAIKGFETVPEGSGKPYRNQEQEQEQEQEIIVVGQEADPAHLVDEAVARWNETAKACGLPEVRKLDQARRQRLVQRLADGGLEAWARALDAVERSRLCRGLVPGKEGAAPWKCNFDFLTKAAGYRKVLEGNYGADIEPPAKGPPPPEETPDEMWLRRLGSWSRQHYWPDDWGPRPGKPGCQVPAHLILTEAPLAIGATA